MTWHPPGWASLVPGDAPAVRYDRLCRCGACRADGRQHEPMCNVHDNDGLPPFMCNCPVGEALRLERGEEPTPWVHVLHGGWALCPLPGIPGEWPPGHRWVAVADAEKATCPHCLREMTEAAAKKESTS